jgi:hypothetical protein
VLVLQALLIDLPGITYVQLDKLRAKRSRNGNPKPRP